MSKNESGGLVNKGIIEINPAPFDGRATLVVVGLTRSGTSMIGSLFQTLGIHMGEGIDKAVFEDVEVARLIESEDYAGLKALVAKRNAGHQVWGFKRPNAYQQLARILPLLRKPRLVVLFRDILAIAMRNHVSMQMDVISTLPKYIAQYQILVDSVAKVKCPALLVSYEKFAQFPEDSIRRTAEFAGVVLQPAKLKEALEVIGNGPETYLQSSRLRYAGHVDRIIDGKLRGWAMVVGEPKIKAKVNLLVGGKVMKSGVANKLRKDLVAANIGGGHHGFEIAVGADLDPELPIDVTAGNANFLLANSGKPVAFYSA